MQVKKTTAQYEGIHVVYSVLQTGKIATCTNIVNGDFGKKKAKCCSDDSGRFHFIYFLPAVASPIVNKRSEFSIHTDIFE